MKYFAIIFLIGFLWITRDIIRVPDNFHDSFFDRFLGNAYIDPKVSWTNQYALGNIFAPILSLGSDLFHLLGTIILGLFFWLILQAYSKKWDFSDWQDRIVDFIIMFLAFGTGNLLGWGFRRQFLNFV